ncbi:hypothetical protein [Janibacter alittae]|uniref:Uncharacterized protein n=1 Tax=Janibacter alittae TaxID=3115209 RepID=A0ABZ2MK36_9MICO
MTMHCPATLLLTATPEGEGGVPALVERLAGERVLTVVTAPGDARGAAVAAGLDVPLEQEPGLEGGELSSALLGEIADLHRGETVLVLARGTGDPAVPITRIELGEAF